MCACKTYKWHTNRRMYQVILKYFSVDHSLCDKVDNQLIVVLVIWYLILLQVKIALGKTLNPKVAPKQTTRTGV